MSKWRYKVEAMKLSSFKKAEDKADLIQEKLTRLGMDGWELVTVLRNSTETQLQLYLKRPY
ncbi:MAG TPA: DUF4177 domain-containing protein [Hellea balneolensis]|uniref:DUF4177 domain-containing protein n=1 Tax=Hellea balneolensis TaxID=287478 RepID=A0A7C5R3C5_9PROT|nr:DUF4177 domain-containing protein [Hellea balneolensis]